MKAYVDGDTDSALVVHGRPGSGKSTLVAAFCSQYDEEVSDGGSKDLFVITHIVGATGERLHVHACKSMAVSVHFESYQTVTPVLPSRGPFLRAHANSLINIGCRTPLQTPPERIHSEAYNTHKCTQTHARKCYQMHHKQFFSDIHCLLHAGIAVGCTSQAGARTCAARCVASARSCGR